jgi:hypothetical protein
MAFKEKDPKQNPRRIRLRTRRVRLLSARRVRLWSAAFFASAALLAWGCGSRVAGTEVQDPHELAGTVEQESGEPP